MGPVAPEACRLIFSLFPRKQTFQADEVPYMFQTQPPAMCADMSTFRFHVPCPSASMLLAPLALRSSLRPLPACPRTTSAPKCSDFVVVQVYIQSSHPPVTTTTVLYRAGLAGPQGWLRGPEIRRPPPTPLPRKNYHFDPERGRTRHSHMPWFGARRHYGPLQLYRHWGSASGAALADSSKRRGGVSYPFFHSLVVS